MTSKHLLQSERLHTYLLSCGTESKLQTQLRQYTLDHCKQSQMMTTPSQTQFLALLGKLIQAHRIIEIGVFTGYATLAIAQVLPDDGLLIACDIDETAPNIGKRFWQQAGVMNKIDLRIAPALTTLQNLLATGQQESFDFVFIDADKINYAQYYELTLQLLRPGGLVVFDNTLAVGEALVYEAKRPATKAIAALNDFLKNDRRVTISMIPLSQGMTLVCKSSDC